MLEQDAKYTDINIIKNSVMKVVEDLEVMERRLSSLSGEQRGNRIRGIRKIRHKTRKMI